jgi:hypothetical protein
MEVFQIGDHGVHVLLLVAEEHKHAAAVVPVLDLNMAAPIVREPDLRPRTAILKFV